MRSTRAWTVLLAVLSIPLVSAAAEAGIWLNDTAGVTWQVSVAKGGRITTTKVSHRVAPMGGIMFNANDGSTAHSFLISVNTDGTLKVTQTEYHRWWPRSRKTNDGWQIGVTRSGKIVSSRNNAGARPSH